MIVIRRIVLPLVLLFPLLLSCVDGTHRQNDGMGRQINVNVVGTQHLTRSGERGAGEELFSRSIVTPAGDTLNLTAYISDYEDAPGTMTKGVPVTTSSLESSLGLFNISVLTDDGQVYYSISPEDSGSSSMEKVSFSYDSDSKGWIPDKSYWWPDMESYLRFYSYAPVPAFYGDGAPVSDLSFGRDGLAFSYASSAPGKDGKDAEVQQDIVFAASRQNCKNNDGFVDFEFRHALTAVRFTNGDITGVVIKSIALNNFYGAGRAAFDGTSFTYTDHGSKASFSQNFGVDVGDFAKGECYDVSDAHEKTFFVIPQELPDDAELEVSVVGLLHPERIKFKELGLKDKEGNPLTNWLPYAGRVITFMISSDKVNNVAVSVDDKLAVVGGYPQKKDVVIKNTGRSNAYIRASLVGNWTNKDGRILASWSEDNPLNVFTGGLLGAGETYWKKGSDGFYYYKYYVKPGEQVKHPLFSTFTITGKPMDNEDSSWDGGVDMQIANLDLTVLVQAVKADSAFEDARDAWGDIVVSESLLTASEDVEL